MMEAGAYIQKLNELSAKKLAFMEEILLFTRSQNEAMKEGRFEEAEPLLEQRQERMNAVDRLDEQFAACSAELKNVLPMDTFEDLPGYRLPGTAELKKLVEGIQEVLFQIKGIEDENSGLVKAELERTRGRIHHSNTFKRVSGAYYPVRNEVPSCYFDKKK